MSATLKVSIIINILLLGVILSTVRLDDKAAPKPDAAPPACPVCEQCKVCETCKACPDAPAQVPPPPPPPAVPASGSDQCLMPDYLDSLANEINEISKYYQNAHNAVMTTDKFSVTYNTHSYETFYGKYLGFFRTLEKFATRPIKLMEIGIGWGGHAASMHVYRKFLKKDQLEYYAYEFLTGHEVRKNRYMSKEEKEYYFSHMHVGDQNNPAHLDAAIAKFGEMDMIVDDGSHVCQHQLTAFKHLFLKGLAPGGVYIIEDLQTNFHKNWGCGLDVQKRHMTFVNMVQDYIALMHFHWWEHPKYNSQKGGRNAYGQESAAEFTHMTAVDLDIMSWIQTIDCDREVCAFRKRLTKMVPRKHGRM